MAVVSRPILYVAFAAGMGGGMMLMATVINIIHPAAARGDVAIMPLVNTRTPLAGAYRAHVMSVIDGDTVEARVHIWMGQEVVTRVRLKDIDAPEITGACGPARVQAASARDRLEALVKGPGMTLTEVRPDKYFGRVVARIVMPDGRDAGAILLSEGLARPYGGGRRKGWCMVNAP